MNGSPDEIRREAPTAVAVAAVPQRRVSWGAILAGTVVAIVTFITLALLGMAVGLATYDPATEGDTARGLATAGMIWWLLRAIIALFLGGWAAGRLSTVSRRVDAVLHGVATWGATTLVVVLLLATAVGGIVGGALNVVSNSIRIPAGTVASMMDRMHSDGMMQDGYGYRHGNPARMDMDYRDNNPGAGVSGSVTGGGYANNSGAGVSGSINTGSGQTTGNVSGTTYDQTNP